MEHAPWSMSKASRACSNCSSAYRIRATFFIVGRDLPAQAASVRELIRRGHEVANHSTWHRPGFARLTREEKRADIATTHRLIMDAAGQPPVGFKSPGFSLGPDQLDVLTELGYLYDLSLLPTFYAPALRSLQRVLSGGHVDPTQYGRALNGLAPLHPYHPAAAAPYRQSGFRTGRPAPRWMRILDKSRSPVCTADSRTCSGIFKTAINSGRRQ